MDARLTTLLERASALAEVTRQKGSDSPEARAGIREVALMIDGYGNPFELADETFGQAVVQLSQVTLQFAMMSGHRLHGKVGLLDACNVLMGAGRPKGA